MRWRRYVIRIVLAFVVILLLFWGFRPQPRLVDTEKASRGAMAKTIEEEGRTRVRHVYRISAPVPGEVRRIELQVGDAVAAGQVVAKIDAQAAAILDVRSINQAEALVAAAAADLDAARRDVDAAAARAAFALAEYERLRTLGEQQLIAVNEVEAAAMAAEQARALQRAADARAISARHELSAARTALSFAGRQDGAASGVVSVHTPVEGQVLRRFFESTRVVVAGEPILEIGDPAQLEVEIDVLSSDAVRIEPGMRVLFDRWGEAELLQGQVRRVEPGGFTKISALGVEEQRVWVIADFTSPPTAARARLGDGYRVNARFILWESQEALRVPLSALFRRNEHWAVFVVEAGRARLQRVDLGERGGRFAQVLGGLQAGDEVIVHPDRDLDEGMRVRPREGRY